MQRNTKKRNLATSSPLLCKETWDLTERENRHPKTPRDKRIPGLDISELSSEKLELLLSLNLDKNALTKEWKIKAAHELATRYIEGMESKKEQKAPHDAVKAYDYAQKEINSYTIEELEQHFFQIENNGNNINIVKHWLENLRHPQAKHEDIRALFKPAKINECIEAAQWNGKLKDGIKRNANTILLAWEKQLIAARLAAHYRQLKKENRDVESALAAKFYKQLVLHLKDHEQPDAKISIVLKKISPRFNQIRLFMARAGKVIGMINGSLPTPVKWLFNIAGLYFLIEFMFDLAVIIKSGPQAFWEDNRPSRMANAAVWFLLNLTCLMLTLLLAPAAPAIAALWVGILTVGGCGFDVLAEVAIGAYAYRNQQQILDKIEGELATLNKTIDDLKYDNTPEQKHQLCAQRDALIETRSQLLNKRKDLYINRAYTIAIMAILTTAAIFIFFPPAALPLAPLIAAGVALGVGSIFGGIGKHLFWNVIMDTQFHQTCKDTFWQTCKTVKHWFVAKEKSPIHNIKASRECSESSHTYTYKHLATGAIARTPTQAATQDKRLANVIHRNSSGDLFTCIRSHSTKPIESITSTPAIKLT